MEGVVEGVEGVEGVEVVEVVEGVARYFQGRSLGGLACWSRIYHINFSVCTRW